MQGVGKGGLLRTWMLKLKGIKDWTDGMNSRTGRDDPRVLFCIPGWIMMSSAKIPEISVIDRTPWFRKTSIISVPLFGYRECLVMQSAGPQQSVARRLVSWALCGTLLKLLVATQIY